MLCLPTTATFGYVGIVATDGLVLEDFQLHIKTFQFGPDIVRTHIRQRHLPHLYVAVVRRQRSVSVDFLEVKIKLKISNTSFRVQ